MNEVVLKSAVEQLELLRSGKISVAELAEAHIQQIERLNPQLNVFADFDADRVRRRARELDASEGRAAAAAWASGDGEVVDCDSGVQVRDWEPAAQGRDPGGGRGGGDAAAAGGGTDSGHDELPRVSDGVRDRQSAARADAEPVGFGAFAGWIERRRVGGDCGGAFGGGAGQSDSGGSVRVPAHFTGICSLKPTPGRIPGRGHLPPCVGPFSTLGAIGPMARTMADVALLFRVLSGQDPCDPASAPVEFHETTRERTAHEHGWSF